MPVNITPVSTFTSPVVAPADGDAVTGSAPATMGQGLANRTEHNKDRLEVLDAYCVVTLSGAGTGDDLTMTLDDESGGFSVAADAVTFPALGTYQVSAFVHTAVNSTSDPDFGGVEFNLNAVAVAEGSGVRLSASAASTFDIHCPTFRCVVTDIGHTLSMENRSGAAMTIDARSHLLIRRIA